MNTSVTSALVEINTLFIKRWEASARRWLGRSGTGSEVRKRKGVELEVVKRKDGETYGHIDG